MSAGEMMMQEQIDGIIGRAELRLEQQCINANAHALHGAEAKRVQGELALLRTGLAKLKTLRDGFSGP